MIKKTIFSLITGISLLAGGALVAPVASAADIDQNSICSGINLDVSDTVGSDNRSCSKGGPENSINKLITSVVNIFSLIVGIAAVIMIIYGGFNFITSGGDSGKISSAKSTVIYAIIGLIIVALAQVIVRFVLGRATS